MVLTDSRYATPLPAMPARLREERPHWALAVLLWCLVIATCLARIVPFSPDMPAAGLDGGWRYGMEQAMAQGLLIGRDIVFTFGPYAAVYTRNYHPATDTLALLASTYLALSYAMTLGLFISGGGKYCILALVVIIASLAFIPDSLLFLLPLLIALQVCRRWPEAGANGLAAQHGPAWLLALLLAPLGFLPLIKGTLVALCAAVALLCAGYVLAQRRRGLAVLCLLAPLLALVLFWLASGQALMVLPSYLAGMLPIISGYSEAMALSGEPHEIVLVALASIAILFAIARHPGMPTASRYFLLLLFAAVLFIAFKAGFVRHDGHAVIASTTVLMAAVALPLALLSPRVLYCVLFGMFSWGVVNYHYQHSTPASVVRDMQATFASAWAGAGQRVRHDGPRSQFDAAVQALRQQASLPVLPGSSDIYSYDQSALIASGNLWAPRPILQSYSAYTPALAEANMRHLLGDKAPHNVFFTVQTIDNRYPSLDDGPSWPVLLATYEPFGRRADTLILTRKPEASWTMPAALAATTQRLGAAVSLAQRSDMLFAQFDIKPGIVGKMASLLLRPPQLAITVTLDNGSTKTFRLVSGMAKAGFLLSPLVENSDEFSYMFGKSQLLIGKRVTSFSINTEQQNRWARWLWQQSYTLRLTPLPSTSVANGIGFGTLEPEPVQVRASAPGDKAECGGMIDVLNHAAAGQGALRAHGVLNIQGWLTPDEAHHRLARQVYVLLTDAHGVRHVVRTQPADRPDVAAAFNNGRLAAAGFMANIDVSTLKGRYTLGLGFDEGNGLNVCPRFDREALIE